MYYSYKQIWFINFPMMSIPIEQLIIIIDTIFLGHVGEMELGASALAGIYYLAVYMLSFGFSIGLQVMVARRNGKDIFPRFILFDRVSRSSFSLIQLLSPFILRRLINSQEVFDAVIRYLDGRSFGLLFSFPFLTIRAFLVGITHTKALSWAVVIAVVIKFLSIIS